MAVAVSDEVRTAAETVIGATSEWTVISSRHSTVWVVRANAGRWSVKHLCDETSDASVEQWLMSHLAATKVRRIHRIVNLSNGSRVVIAPFVEGELLSTRLERGIAPETSALVAGDLRSLLGEISRIPPTTLGFGRLGGGRQPIHQRWSHALRDYLEEQRKKGPQSADRMYKTLSETLGELADRFDAEVVGPRVHPTDVNMHNFLLRQEDGRLLALNFPAIWQGDAAMPFGILQLHLDQTSVASAILDGRSWPSWRLHFYAMYHAFVICVYAERFSATPLDEVAPWGRNRPFVDLFEIHRQALEASR
jgi:hypothetical protein